MNEFNCSIFLLLKVKIMTFSFKLLLNAMISSFESIIRLIDDNELVNIEKWAENNEIS